MATERANEEQSAKEKAIADWLPVGSSRKAKWYYSAFHNITAMVGAGVLGMPYAMSELGWGPGMVVMALSWIVTLYTLWQMVEMHEMVPGKRLDRYHELGQQAFGQKLGFWIVVPQQIMVEVSTCIVYMVTGGQSLMKVHEIACSGRKCHDIRQTYWIMIFASVHFLLSHLPNFHSLSAVSLSAAVMSLTYSAVAVASSLARGRLPDVDYGPRSSTTPGRVFGAFSAIGGIAFAYAAHSVVLEIQATIPSTPEKPSKVPMWKGVIFAYVFTALCYFSVAISGFYVLGNRVDDNILITLQKPAWVVLMANLMVVVHVIGGYQVYAMPVFDMVESFLVKSMDFQPSARLRFITRTVYVAFTMFIGMAIPFFGGLMGLFGGLVLAPASFYLPCIIWLILKKPKRFSFTWIANTVYAMSVFDMVESFLVKSMNFQPSARLRFITRTFYVTFTMFISMAIPFFGGLMGLIGVAWLKYLHAKSTLS